MARECGGIFVATDQMDAIKHILKQQGASLEVQNAAAEIKIRAEGKIGKILPVEFPHGGDRKSRLDHQTLKDQG